MNQSKPIVCLDAGHYGRYNRSPVVAEYYESDMTWALQGLLKEQLEQRGVSVIVTRTDKDTDLALVARGQKSRGAELFVSLHSNAASTAEPDWVVGICSVVDQRGREIATALSAAVAKVMGVKYQITSRASSQDRDGDGRKDDYYGVLRGASGVGTPGVILEHGFHTNEANARWLLKEENLALLAKTEAEVICKWLKKEEELVNISLPMLQKGASGDTVKALQALLTGYGDKLDVDGIFGPATDTGVRRYQKARALSVDGIVGPATWASLLGR